MFDALVSLQEKKRVPLCSDLKLLQVDLQLRKARVYRSIPYSRLGSNRDAHCYRKAYPHLLAFKVRKKKKRSTGRFRSPLPTSRIAGDI